MNIFETFLNGRVFWETLPLVLSGLFTTLALGASGIVASFFIGMALALARLYAARPWRWLAIAYIDLFRSIPVLVLLIVIYNALPFVGIRLSAFAAALSAIAMVGGAYSAEIFRAGIEAVPRGQFEGALALGFHPMYTLLKVVLPQALVIVVPPVTSNAINILKDTALASVVAMPDLLKQANQAQALAANPTPLITAAAIYIILLLPLVRLVGHMEKSWSKGRR